jgi:hypothetical protein
MKQLFFILLVLINLSCYCQSVRQDANGNFYAVKKTQDSTDSKPTGKTFTTAKGEVFDVYVSGNGKYYVIRKSRNGNTYKQYLKL